MPLIDHLAGMMLTRILWTSLQAAVLAGLVALLIRLLPRLPAAARCALWWLVALQVVLGLCVPSPINLPLLAPAHTEAVAAAPRVTAPVENTAHANAAPPGARPGALAPAGRNAVSDWTDRLIGHWRAWLLALWVIGLLAQVPAIVLQRRRLRELLRDARDADAPLRETCVRQARQMGLRRCPDVLVSRAIASPLVTGLPRPVILWPGACTLTRDESALALAHELAHLKRGDLWLGIIPALAQWLFFFHPLVRRGVREYALYREAACDAVVLQHGTAPHDYGNLLLHIGVQPALHAGLGGASRTFRTLKQRLNMLEQRSSAWARAAGWGLAVVVLTAALPYRLVAAATHAHGATGAQTRSEAPPVPPTPPSAAIHTSAPPPAAPPAPPPPPTPPPPPSSDFHANNVDVDIDSNASYGITLFGSDSVLVEGNEADLAAAKRLYKVRRDSTLWVRRGDKAYVTHDPVTIDRAEAIYGQLTAARRDVARMEGKLWRVKGPLEGLHDRQQDVDERVHDLRADPDAPAVAARLASLDAQKSGIAARTATLRQQLAALRPQQDAARQRLQQANARADRQVEQLMTEAIAQGKVQATDR